MTALVEKALRSITKATNLSTGLTHPNDKNRAKEMFKRLREAGEILSAQGISAWAEMNGWQRTDAAELGALAERIGLGNKVKITNGPFWRDDILEILRKEEG